MTDELSEQIARQELKISTEWQEKIRSGQVIRDFTQPAYMTFWIAVITIAIVTVSNIASGTLGKWIAIYRTAITAGIVAVAVTSIAVTWARSINSGLRFTPNALELHKWRKLKRINYSDIAAVTAWSSRIRDKHGSYLTWQVDICAMSRNQSQEELAWEQIYFGDSHELAETVGLELSLRAWLIDFDSGRYHDDTVWKSWYQPGREFPDLLERK